MHLLHMIHMVHDTYDAYDRSAEKCIICRGKQGTTKQHMVHMVRDEPMIDMQKVYYL